MRFLLSASLALTNLPASVPNLLAPLACFAIYISTGHGSAFNVARVFPAISLVALITQPLLVFFQAVPQFMSMFACLTRIQEFLATDTTEQVKTTDSDSTLAFSDKSSATDTEKQVSESKPLSLDETLALSIEDCSFNFEASAFSINNASLHVRHGQFVSIIGPPGCGKSVLCQAALGDVQPTRGRVRRSEANIAYCSQSPWLTNGTIRENIIFNTEFDQAWYERVLECCAFKDEVGQMPNADETMVGSNGFALSGGQRQRLVCCTPPVAFSVVSGRLTIYRA